MARAAREIVVNAPLSAVYNQWTQFEEFPLFMDGVASVRQLDDAHLHWQANIGGHAMEWDAEIREQVPDEKIVWLATDGATNAGLVSFQPHGPEETVVHLEMSYEPQGFTEKVGDALGVVERQVESDLERFKTFIETRHGHETGGWRGEIENPNVASGHTRGAGSNDVEREVGQR